jgi:hypothetical protein
LLKSRLGASGKRRPFDSPSGTGREGGSMTALWNCGDPNRRNRGVTIETECRPGVTLDDPIAEGLPERNDRLVAAAVTGDDEIRTELLQVFERAGETFGACLVQVEASQDGAESRLAARPQSMVQGVHETRVTAADEHNESTLRTDPQRLIVRDRIALESGGIEEEGPTGVFVTVVRGMAPVTPTPGPSCSGCDVQCTRAEGASSALREGWGMAIGFATAFRIE